MRQVAPRIRAAALRGPISSAKSVIMRLALFRLLTTAAFYTPDFFKSYDKIGKRFLVDTIKRAYCGKKVRMIQAKMERFFDEPSRFCKSIRTNPAQVELPNSF
jgi:hypothetical protein